MAPKRESNHGDYRKLKNMLDELKVLKQELLPEDGRPQTEEELKGFDDFQRLKHQLASKLQSIRGEVDRLNEIRRAKGDERDAMTIRMHTDNTLSIKEALVLFNELKEILKKDEAKTGKKRLDEKELSDRRKYMQLLGEEIKILTNDNSAVKVAVTSEDLAIQSRREKRRAKEREEREKRRGRRTGGGDKGVDIQDDDFRETGPQSEQEQLFEAKVAENMAEQDKMLEEISRGLDELKELATEANKHLTVQQAMIEQVGDKMDETIGQFQTANKRLKQILDQSGGVTRWCPMLLCAVLLLALVGYMFKIV